MSERDIDRFAFSAWQRVDDQHPPDAGQPAYRVVYKTLRVVLGEGEIRFPNLVIRFGHGDVERGGVHLGSAVRGRRRGDWYLPESGRLVKEGSSFRYAPDPPLNFEFHGWENTVESVFFVEMILVCESVEPHARIAEGRRKLASLKTLLELQFGSRFLGLLLTEEIGALHADGFWTRSLASDRLANEWSFDVRLVEVKALLAFNEGSFARHIARPQADKSRLSLACDWYWSAIHAEEPVTEYLQLWFVVEVIAMPNTTNIAPIKDRLASEIGGQRADWKLVGNHFGRRGRLVHGQGERDVDDQAVDELRNLVEVLLCLEFGIVDKERFDRLRTAAGLP
jgi:hypothetical protein